MAQVKDPVCGMTIDTAKAAGRVTFGGRTYYFCSQECQEQFEAAPARYAVTNARRNTSQPADVRGSQSAAPKDTSEDGGERQGDGRESQRTRRTGEPIRESQPGRGQAAISNEPPYTKSDRGLVSPKFGSASSAAEYEPARGIPDSEEKS